MLEGWWMSHNAAHCQLRSIDKGWHVSLSRAELLYGLYCGKITRMVFPLPGPENSPVLLLCTGHFPQRLILQSPICVEKRKSKHGHPHSGSRWRTEARGLTISIAPCFQSGRSPLPLLILESKGGALWINVSDLRVLGLGSSCARGCRQWESNCFWLTTVLRPKLHPTLQCLGGANSGAF